MNKKKNKGGQQNNKNN